MKFKIPWKVKMYNAAVKAHSEKHPDLFHKGKRHIGSNYARYFWWGFDGIPPYGRPASESKDIVLYPVWCAGRDLGKD
ncbi:MAG: hypothetical protein GY820_39045 [Gammaproteobacteria bacterium]|nr:hypothetical protein [Gammaproteobacteria bacterium]